MTCSLQEKRKKLPRTRVLGRAKEKSNSKRKEIGSDVVRRAFKNHSILFLNSIDSKWQWTNMINKTILR